MNCKSILDKGYKPKMKYDEMKQKIIDMTMEGKSVDEICKSIEAVPMIVNAIRCNINTYDYDNSEFISVNKLNKFRDLLEIGTKIKVPRYCIEKIKVNRIDKNGKSYSYLKNNEVIKYQTAIVLRKFPFVAETDIGYFQYIDLYKGIKI